MGKKKATTPTPAPSAPPKAQDAPKVGRPRIELSPEQRLALSVMAKLHCPNSEIAIAMGMSEDTLTRNFAEEIDKGRIEGKRKLRMKQWDTAMKGNVVMQIFLGKQMLGQSEKVESKNENSNMSIDGMTFVAEWGSKAEELPAKGKDGADDA